MMYFTELSLLNTYTLFILIEILSATYFVILFLPIYIIFYKEKQRNLFYLICACFSIAMLENILPRFFHWTLPNLMQNFTYFNQISSIAGSSTGTFFILFFNFSFFVLAQILMENHTYKKILPRIKENKKFIIVNLIFICFIFSYGIYRIKTHEKYIYDNVNIGFIQPNFTFEDDAYRKIPALQPQKKSLQLMLQMSEKLILTSQKKIDLLVWPESTAPQYTLYDDHVQKQIQDFIKKYKIPILINAIQVDFSRDKETTSDTPIWSSSFIYTEDGLSSEIFQKWLPMPFGEHIPFEEDIPWIGHIYRKLFPNASLLKIGNNFRSLRFGERFNVAPLICFDSILQKLPYLQAKYGNAQFFINQSNFVWMANSNAGHEFSLLNQARAIENARSVFMISNSGPTFAFDPIGRPIFQSSETLTQGSGVVTLPISDEGTIFSYFGATPLTVVGAAALLFLILERKKKEE